MGQRTRERREWQFGSIALAWCKWALGIGISDPSAPAGATASFPGDHLARRQGLNAVLLLEKQSPFGVNSAAASA